MDDDPFDKLRRELRGGGAAASRDERDDRFGLRHLAIGGALVLVLGLAVVLTSAVRQTPHEGATPPALDELEPPAPPSTTTPANARVWPAEPVEIIGIEVRTGDHRWTVGATGDLVAVGDWNCDGTATPAVVRPSASRLYVFDTWATMETPATATPGPTVPDGVVDLVAEGCGRATLRTADGRTHLVAIAGAP